MYHHGLRMKKNRSLPVWGKEYELKEEKNIAPREKESRVH
jgi:hypothetical protein